MFNGNNERIAKLKRDTRVLFHKKGSREYLMTNDTGSQLELLPVFSADQQGKVYMEGYLLGSIFAHDPYIISDLEKVECTFEEMNPAYFDSNPVTDGLIGQAVGDALGVPVEFLSRDEVRELNINEMIGNDCKLSFESRWSSLIPSGAWSDDTSMTIAAMASVIRNHGEIDYDDIMKQFLEWWENGKYTSLKFPFGLGNNISHALQRYKWGTPALDCGGKKVMDNGNGALMRMFPFSMYAILRDYNDDETLPFIKNAARITHGHEINVCSCYIYTQFLYECIRTKNPKLAYVNAICHKEAEYRNLFSPETIRAHESILKQMDKGDFDPDSIPENGYVVTSLTVALYSILNTKNYEDAIKMAVSFGYDTDTNAAITGSIAGVLYGMQGIPERWLCKLRKKDELIQLGEAFELCCRCPEEE